MMGAKDMRPSWIDPNRGRQPATASGRLVRLTVNSEVLRDNYLGDPFVRELPVYLPPGYDEEADRRYPVAFYLTGYMGIGDSKLQWKGFAPTFPERLDRLIADGEIGPVIVAFPDCFTTLGGSQYINSTVTGAYDDHLNQELVPLVDAECRTLEGRDHRAVFGKSSGGFGAIVQGMLHPETWGALACHSGDSYFEFCFLADLPRSLNAITKAGSVRRFLETYRDKNKHSSAASHALMHLAMAACFDPQPDHPDGFEMPVDLYTGRLIPERWERWLAWDPVRMIPNYSEALSSMRALFIDCGTKDQYHLHYGARQMHQVLDDQCIEHRFEEFDDNHSGIDYRIAASLKVLYPAIAATA